MKNLGGRPKTAQVVETCKLIISRVANGETLRGICGEKGMPSVSTFHKMIGENSDLRKLYLIAKESRAHVLFDEAIFLSRKLSDREWMKDENVTVAALRTSIDTLLKAAARLAPREYGERVTVNPVVPIIINTSLNLGQLGKPQANKENVYKLQAVTPVDVEVAEVEHRRLPFARQQEDTEE